MQPKDKRNVINGKTILEDTNRKERTRRQKSKAAKTWQTLRPVDHGKHHVHIWTTAGKEKVQNTKIKTIKWNEKIENNTEGTNKSQEEKDVFIKIGIGLEGSLNTTKYLLPDSFVSL